MIGKLIEWYRVNFVPYITLCAATEHAFISKALWHKIVKNIPVEKRSELRVFFEKYPIRSYIGQGTSGYLYRFFVNTDLSAIKTPEGEEPFTTQIQFGRFGHVGFQTVQPTPIEILSEYKIATPEFVKYNFSDYVSLKVQEKRMPNGEAYYIVLPVEVNCRYRPTDEDPDPKTLLNDDRSNRSNKTSK